MRRYGHAAVVYAVLLHVLVGVLVGKTDFLTRVGKRLGLVPPEEKVRRARALGGGAGAPRPADAGAALVVLGDSIAEQIDASRLAGDAVNYGIGGDTVRTLLWRLPVLRSVEHARAIVVNIGVNDLMYTAHPGHRRRLPRTAYVAPALRRFGDDLAPAGG